MIELLLLGAAISAVIGALMAPSKGMSPVTGLLAGALGILGLVWIARQDPV